MRIAVLTPTSDGWGFVIGAAMTATNPQTASAWAVIIDALADLGRSEIERRARQSSGDPDAVVAPVIGPTDDEVNADEQREEEVE